METPVGVIADAHGNLPALQAALGELRARDCDRVVHVGDAIGIGPHPSQVLDLLREENVVCLMGNHDDYFVRGLPTPLPSWMSLGEATHQHWVHEQCTVPQREWVRSWPDQLDETVRRVPVRFMHYPRRDDGEFAGIVPSTAMDLNGLFSNGADTIVFGHDHSCCDVTINGRRFLNPGSLGCHDRPQARMLLLSDDLTSETPALTVERVAVPYDDTQLLADFDRLAVPERDFLRLAFLPRLRAEVR